MLGKCAPLLPPLVLEPLIHLHSNGVAEPPPTPRGMASTPTRNEEKKGSRLFPAASSVGGGPKVSLSRSEEFLARISKELTDEALFIAGYHLNPAPTKEKQTQDQGTQISKHVFVAKTRGTDTRSDRNRTRTKAHLLPSPREKKEHGNLGSWNSGTL
ncbi:putative protein T-ENOL isoform X2 [Tamandua tetradactyla]|uniref:putative protein T-ENOL isoform X2 n=1 Tax=Tamandua tetradactyla TaxID=48850 RepID=UPI0040539A15